ncbi:DbpA RNA binding domain-containing protein [Tenacibaculum sp. SG-28]|uniref:DbpA RNA binding domain-containing protein n=1 Tax=Tenacibaculum sp. SG-28 TaxID=754426 RepID=UPI003516E53C
MLHGNKEDLPEFLKNIPTVDISKQQKLKSPYWTTLFLSGGRKDKISKGDIAGLFFKKGNLNKEQLGVIELKQDCAFIAVPKTEAKNLVVRLNNTKLKNKKVRITEI